MQTRQRLNLIHAHEAFSTVERVLHALTQAGAEAVLAGGCVRDALLGVAPKDLDVATSAPPDMVERLFPRTLAVGKAFGTIVVVENGFNFEVTTYRSEGAYLDGRHPSSVTFTTMEEDSRRRDFTVNALYYDPESSTIFDYATGIEDLQLKRIQTVGLARERFQEDHLRLLRAARFVAQLGFTVERRTKEAMMELHSTIKKVSIERVFNEVKRLLGSRYLMAGLEVLLETDLAEDVWPEIVALDRERLRRHLQFLDWENALAAIYFLLDQDPEPRLRAWKAPRETLKNVNAQIQAAKTILNPKSRKSDRLMAFGSSHYAGILVLVAGAMAARGDEARLDEWLNEYLQVAEPNGELPKALVSGQDLLALGLSASPAFGEILRKVYEAQLEGKIRGRDEALKMARGLAGH